MARAKAKADTPALRKLRVAVAKSKDTFGVDTRNAAGDDVSDVSEFERNTDAAIASAEALAKEQQILDSAAPTDEQAMEFAKLLRSGVPQYDAVCYILGPMPSPLAEVVLQRWMRSGNVVEALATINGGRWPALDEDARLDVALSKHYSELAHYLYTHDYDSADGPTQRKIDAAREALEGQRAGRMQQNSPFAKFLATLLKGEVQIVPGHGPVRRLSDGERPSVLGLADVEPGDVTVEGEVAETEDEE